MAKKEVHVIDGNNWVSRAYHSVRGLEHNGIPTNAIHGFMNMVHSAIEIYDIKYIVFAFDIQTTKTWRYAAMNKYFKSKHGKVWHNKEDAYKGGRNTEDEERKSKRIQIEYIRQLLVALGFTVLDGSEGLDEADDIIGTVAKNGKAGKYRTYIHSNDKDFAQLLTSKKVRIIKPKLDCWVEYLNCKHVFNVEPNQVVDFLAMQGDSIDGISGINGIGKKTAIDILEKYGSFDNAYEHIDEMKGREGGALRRAREQGDLRRHMKFLRKMIKLRTKLDYVPKDPKAFKIKKADSKAVKKLGKKLGLTKTAIVKDYL